MNKYADVEMDAKMAANRTPSMPFPPEKEICDVEGYAGNKDGILYLDPNGEPVTTDEMYRKIERQSWNA